MNENAYTCPYCYGRIMLTNKIMHELNCQKKEPAENIRINSNGQAVSNEREEIRLLSKNSQEKDTSIDDLYYCQKCNNYMEIHEKTDHLLCHQFEERNASDRISDNNGRKRRTSSRTGDRQFTNLGQDEGRNQSRRISSHEPQATQSITIQTLPNGGMISTQTIRDANGNITVRTETTSNSTTTTSNRPPNLNSNFNFESIFGNNPRFAPLIIRNSGDRAISLNQFLLQILGGVRQNGVSEEIVNDLSEFSIDNLAQFPSDKKDCVICMSTFQVGETALFLPCMHIFHSECIKNWFKSNNTCPICKFSVDNSSMNGN